LELPPVGWAGGPRPHAFRPLIGREVSIFRNLSNRHPFSNLNFFSPFFKKIRYWDVPSVQFQPSQERTFSHLRPATRGPSFGMWCARPPCPSFGPWRARPPFSPRRAPPASARDALNQLRPAPPHTGTQFCKNTDAQGGPGIDPEVTQQPTHPLCFFMLYALQSLQYVMVASEKQLHPSTN
jgi:hypothetical protein